jgi:hypothetical protein
MRIRTAAPLAIAALLAVSASGHAASKPKPITGTFKSTLAPMPATLESCLSPAQVEGVNKHSVPIKVAGPGTLAVKVTGFYGDWDTILTSSTGAVLAEGGGTNVDGTNSTPVAPVSETLKYKSKKAQTLTLVVCNFSGSPEATTTYTYTY